MQFHDESNSKYVHKKSCKILFFPWSIHRLQRWYIHKKSVKRITINQCFLSCSSYQDCIELLHKMHLCPKQLCSAHELSHNLSSWSSSSLNSRGQNHCSHWNPLPWGHIFQPSQFHFAVEKWFVVNNLEPNTVKVYIWFIIYFWKLTKYSLG